MVGSLVGWFVGWLLAALHCTRLRVVEGLVQLQSFFLLGYYTMNVTFCLEMQSARPLHRLGPVLSTRQVFLEMAHTL